MEYCCIFNITGIFDSVKIANLSETGQLQQLIKHFLEVSRKMREVISSILKYFSCVFLSFLCSASVVILVRQISFSFLRIAAMK